mmetsp:Transcript_61868/g.146592  ORF Transcript_61868/g.146592 Transcript_61868/m.146592 type:complete len:285 (+) Transcript_61868:72-926(+)
MAGLAHHALPTRTVWAEACRCRAGAWRRLRQGAVPPLAVGALQDTLAPMQSVPRVSSTPSPSRGAQHALRVRPTLPPPPSAQRSAGANVSPVTRPLATEWHAQLARPAPRRSPRARQPASRARQASTRPPQGLACASRARQALPCRASRGSLATLLACKASAPATRAPQADRARQAHAPRARSAPSRLPRVSARAPRAPQRRPRLLARRCSLPARANLASTAPTGGHARGARSDRTRQSLARHPAPPARAARRLWRTAALPGSTASATRASTERTARCAHSARR